MATGFGKSIKLKLSTLIRLTERCSIRRICLAGCLPEIYLVPSGDSDRSMVTVLLRMDDLGRVKSR